MAEDNAAKGEGSAGESGGKGGKGGKNKNLTLVVMGLVLVGLSVGGTIAALKMFGPQPVAQSEMAGEEEAAPKKKPAIYFPLKPELIVTYQAHGRRRYAQIGITLLLRDEDVLSALDTHKPMILNALNMIIGGQAYDEVQTAEGKELLRLQCLEELQRLMEQEIGKPGIEQVLFTDFVMQ